ncbi:hypothetical protein BD560DRAFT_412571 [Blakeslea trispora]|nr:hypothetical protein BD560DRAFT_412571 [Blakeslea trispora]
MFNYQTTDKQYFVPNKPFNETDLRDLLEPDVDLFLLQTLPHAFEASSPKTIDSLSDNASSSPISQYVDDFKESELVVHESTNDFFPDFLNSDIQYEKPMSMRNDSNLEIRVLGVPNTGAKSRVETQIKLCIQLMTKDEKKVLDWSHIRLSENMLARSRLRKNQQKQLSRTMDGPMLSMVSDESKVLNLEAKVICASNTDHPIRMCASCVGRERRRAERTKDGKPKANSSLLPEEVEAERDRILLFNCNPLVDFASGDAILPSRITCYCRHHDEKLGFRICFTMKNNQGHLVATGMSPPIMITDDHKGSKQKGYRKRSRNESISSLPQTPAISRQSSVTIEDDCGEEEMQARTPTNFDFAYSISASKDLIPILPEPFIVQPTISGEKWPYNRRRRTMTGYASSDASTNTLFNTMIDAGPQLDRLVPSQGPTYGGIEVTLLGSGFYRGLTCMFGEHAATTVHCSADTMVCVLPPATQTGPVVVSFKQHPLVLESQDVAIFSYYDASDSALLELALQVVGLKMTGKLQDAKHVAMRIVQGDQQSTYQDCVLEAVERSNASVDYTQVNTNGHTLLHLAVLLRNERLLKALMKSYLHRPEEERLALLNIQDRNKMTALHFACQLKLNNLVRVLLYAGASANLKSNWGLPSASCGKEDSDLLDLLDLYENPAWRKLVSRRCGHMNPVFPNLNSADSIKVIASMDLASLDTTIIDQQSYHPLIFALCDKPDVELFFGYLVIAALFVLQTHRYSGLPKLEVLC